MEIHVFELNLIITIEDYETCAIEKEIERVKCKENVSELEVKNKIKEFAVLIKTASYVTKNGRNKCLSKNKN